VVIGDGTDSSGSSNACPINVYYESLHGQSVYTAAELNAAGIYGPVDITEIGFNVTGTPDLAMPNYLVRMGHTTAENVSSWISASALSNVWTSASYQPTQTGWDMLTLSTPFTWNGTDNLVIDTAYGLIGEWDSSGTTQYTSINAGYRYIRNDYNDQTEVFSGGYTSSYRPNIKLNISVEPQDEPEIVVDPLSLAFGEVEVGQSNIQQFSIQNAGTESLTGSITTPNGYAVSEVAARNNGTPSAGRSAGLRTAVSETRNTLSFTIAPGASENYDVIFSPTEVTAYNGNVVITSNDSDEPTINMAVTGNGFIPPTISLDDNELAASLNIGAEDTDSFIISNLGSQELTYALSESPTVDWFSFTPGSGGISGGGSQEITGTFSAAGLAPGTYQTTLLVDSNDAANPQLSISVDLEVVNISPTIDLPSEGFTFDMNGSLMVDFTPYVGDPDDDPLSLSCSENINVYVSIDGLSVTLTAATDWFGSENVTFTVSDGTDEASDTASITVNLNHLDIPQITAITRSPSGTTIQWNAVTNASTYHVYRCLEPYGTYEYLGSTSSLSYEDPQMFDMAYYQIKAAYEVPVTK